MVERIEINLIPNEYRVHRKSISIPPDLVFTSLFSIVAIVVSLFLVKMEQEKVDFTKQEIAEKTAEINRLRPVETEIRRLQATQSSLRGMHQGLMSISVDRSIWMRLLEMYSGNLPPNMWLNTLVGQEQGSGGSTAFYSMRLRGTTSAFGEVGQYMARLSAIEGVSDVKVLEVRNSGQRGGRSFDFEIQHRFQAAPSSIK